MSRLTGKTLRVTTAAPGIDRASVKCTMKVGARVIATDINIAPPSDLTPGDVVEFGIDGVGTQKQKVIEDV